MRVDCFQLAEFALARQLRGELEVRQVPPLHAALEDPGRTADGVGQGQALHNVLRAGLFAIHVFARLGREDRKQGVPVRAGGDQYGVDVGPGQQFAEVAIGGAIGDAVDFLDAALHPFRRSARTSQQAAKRTSGCSMKQPMT